MKFGYCAVCGKRCQSWERNADGTYLHTTCAMGLAVWAQKPNEKEKKP